jgi:hypothetical protein
MKHAVTEQADTLFVDDRMPVSAYLTSSGSV